MLVEEPLLFDVVRDELKDKTELEIVSYHSGYIFTQGIISIYGNTKLYKKLAELIAEDLKQSKTRVCGSGIIIVAVEVDQSYSKFKILSNYSS